MGIIEFKEGKRPNKEESTVIILRKIPEVTENTRLQSYKHLRSSFKMTSEACLHHFDVSNSEISNMGNHGGRYVRNGHADMHHWYQFQRDVGDCGKKGERADQTESD
ncbi:hypothetical protein TURU_165051 [Turdus rufiventris]|nr:hypothetical protein TURU_165051 [Turdus rufiventris]